MIAVRRALLSCYDKTGLADFANGLAGFGVELIASDGTAKLLNEQGLRVKTVEEFAGISEQLDGRVKTLHPRLHAGILAKRDEPSHLKVVGSEGLIDLVVVNLYPFEATIQRPGVTVGEALEQIDIGGAALLRAAAKNFPSVTVVSRPAQYPDVLEAIAQGKGTIAETLRRRLSVSAFELTSRYDAAIAAFLGGGLSVSSETLTVQARRHRALRYGENPHQAAGWYVPLAQLGGGLAGARVLQGKELSYNNVVDLDTVARCLHDFEEPTCVIVKHASPCGVASASSVSEAYRLAWGADAESAFGGIVGINRPLDRDTALRMHQTFLELIVAPTIPDEVRALFADKPNLRLIELSSQPRASFTEEWNSVLGGWLVQASDVIRSDPATSRVVTTRHPTKEQMCDLQFAWIAAKHVKSNAIVLASARVTVGIGQGQPSRVRAVRLAIQQAAVRAKGAVLASDGFFPFPDNVECAAQAGVTAIIQPGGSVKDPEVIAAADHAGIAMVFTGTRHFRH
ncbi:MAG: bifunctional phosphoribosylaminoimidazolecarboxamide formyltransferase/IMP cyclohydrolase [Candidatus Omnitrophica bacterium]|nr:bifunctional phosphoribosylaminoimidazolecarboxamide formyltransferase/IMP cyclohydrolase [Candidatus Omnitrophota bacterium]